MGSLLEKGLLEMKESPWLSLGLAFVLIVFSAFLFFFKLGDIGLFDVDEPSYAEAAREMLETGDYITPRFNYKNRYDKPVLFYWLIALSYQAFGVNEFAVRFPSAIAGLILIVSTFYFVRRFIGTRAGFLSALMLATNLAVVAWSRAAVTDMLLTLFLSWGFFSFFMAHHTSETKKKAWYYGLYLMMALAALTKGLVGIVIPALVIIPYLLATGGLRQALKECRVLPGFLIFLAVALPWYLLEIQASGWEFIDAFFIKHHFVRYTGVVSGHRGPILYFIPVVLVGFFPWSAYLPLALTGAIPNKFRALRSTSAEGRLPLFAAWWFLAIFLFFSLAGTKLPSYILPSFPAMAILVGGLWDLELTPRPRGWGFLASHIFLVLMALLLALGFFLAPTLVERARATSPALLPDPKDLGTSTGLLGIGFLICGISPLLFRSLRYLGLGTLALTMVYLSLVLILQVAPLAYAHLQSALKDFALTASARLGSGGELALFGANNPSVVFYGRRPVKQLGKGEKEALKGLLASHERVYVITKASLLPEIGGLNVFLVERRGAYALVSNRPPD